MLNRFFHWAIFLGATAAITVSIPGIAIAQKLPASGVKNDNGHCLVKQLRGNRGKIYCGKFGIWPVTISVSKKGNGRCSGTYYRTDNVSRSRKSGYIREFSC